MFIAALGCYLLGNTIKLITVGAVLTGCALVVLVCTVIGVIGLGMNWAQKLV